MTTTFYLEPYPRMAEQYVQERKETRDAEVNAATPTPQSIGGVVPTSSGAETKASYTTTLPLMDLS